MKNWKRILFLFHRWVGILLCSFFMLWFVSGIFMIYVEFPQLTQPERLAGEASLDFSTATLTPAQALARLTRADLSTRGAPSTNETLALVNPNAPIDTPKSVELSMQFGRPIYIVHDHHSQPRLVFADNGEVLRDVTPEMAVKSALEFAKTSGRQATRIQYRGLLQTDQWTVSAALNDHRPLHLVALNDVFGTEYYLSSRTGAVVRDSNREERVLNYFAAVTHWLYPTFIRKYPDAWAWMVDLLSGLGTVFAVSGLWIGILRWRRKRAPGKPAVPYRGLMRWHYFTGVIFGVTLLTWVFSGFLSMNPGGLNPSRLPSRAETASIAGRQSELTAFGMLQGRVPQDAVEAELYSYAGQPFYLVLTKEGERKFVSAGGPPGRLPTTDRLFADASGLLPGVAVSAARVLTTFDDYYYTRHPERAEKSLPVLRVEFGDVGRTWFHIDPLTGRVLDRSTRTNRLFRWLYNGLHSWDIRWLWERRPLWDIAVIAFMGGGMFLSALGVVVGVRRLKN